MVGGVPVLCGDLEGEGEAEEVVDCGDYRPACVDGEGAVLFVGG